MCFDAKQAEVDLKKVFYLVKDELKVSNELIEERVQEDVIREIQFGRLSKVEKLKEVKAELQLRFRDFRFEGRVKSLTSLFGKHLQKRKLMDAFGIKVIVGTIEECYEMASWVSRNYSVFEYKDKIVDPKPNGYRDLKLIVEFDNSYLEFIIQTASMYIDASTLQAHHKAYPWKYRPEILNLPSEYREIKF